MRPDISAAVMFSLGIVFSAGALAGDIQPYKAQDIQPYRAQEVQPYRAQEIQPYKAQEAHIYTKEERTRMDEQTRQEAKRIAAQRRGNAAPGTAGAAQQAYWQQQMMHRTTEAYNPDVTYNGR